MLWRGPMGGGAASGKVGAMVASHNSGGQYVRARVTPTNPRTPQQSAVRNATRTLSPFWSSTLTQTQRDGWAVYSANTTFVNRIGDTIRLSGIAAFVRSNVSRIQAGLPIIPDAPIIFDTGQGTDFVSLLTTANSFDFTATLNTISAGWNDTTSSNRLLLYASRPQNPGIGFFNGPYRLIGSFPPPGSTGTFSGTLPFQAAAANSQIRFAWRVSYEDGRLTSQGQDVSFPQ